MRIRGGWISGYLCALSLLLTHAGASAQDLSPRAFWPAPEGTRILTVGYSYTSGDTLTDPSLPISGVNSDLHRGFIGVFQTFNLAGRTANLIFEQPYTWGESDVFVGETIDVSKDLDGFSDLGITTSINLYGAPSMDREEFAALRRDPGPIVGASLRVEVPTGKYDKGDVINTGSNRWAARPEIGLIYPLHPSWILELEGGVWLFADNDDFVGGKREQDPIYAAELHLVRRFSPGFWASLDLNYYRGGRSTVGGEKLDDVQRESKYGVTVVVPYSKGKAVRLNYTGGGVSGGDEFDAFLISFNFAF